MSNASVTANSSQVRVGFGVAAGLVMLLGVALLVRPDMLPLGMRMIHGLIVGFGL